MSYNFGEEINAQEAVKEGQNLIPAGKYLVWLQNYEEKIGKESGVPYLNCTVEVVDGPFKGRKFFKMFHMFSTNETAKKIARAEMSAIAIAVGVEKFNDMDQIMFKPFECMVGIEESGGSYPDKNKLVKVLPPEIKPEVKAKPQMQQAQVAPHFQDDIPF